MFRVHEERSISIVRLLFCLVQNLATQVIMTGAPHHRGVDDANNAPTPAEAAANGGGQRVLAAPEAHPLRAHWDYLAFLFRRLPALAPEEELERGYRDYLQARSWQAFVISVSRRLQLSTECLHQRAAVARCPLPGAKGLARHLRPMHAHARLAKRRVLLQTLNLCIVVCKIITSNIRA